MSDRVVKRTREVLMASAESYRDVGAGKHGLTGTMTMPFITNKECIRSFVEFAQHLHTNTIGPIIVAQKLIELSPAAPPNRMIFISSDSGSATSFRDFEDGFGAYAASKAALNQMLRHMAAELKRRGDKWQDICILAMHPGEVST